MKKILTAAAVAGATASVIAAASGSAQTSGGRTLTLFENAARESDAFVDNAPKSQAKNPDNPRFRLSVGDELIARTPVLARKGGARIGTSYAHAVVVRGRTFEGAALQAQVLVALADGDIVLAGLGGTAQRPFAVVGGTGAYEGAHGSAIEKETGGGADLTIRLLP
jgi:hypothetical protein